MLGHRAEYLTFAWMVWEVTHDALYLGYLGLAQGVPLVVFQLWGGVLADRANRLRLLLGTQILTTAVLLAAFALSVSGTVRVAPLLALAAMSNTFRASTSRPACRSCPRWWGGSGWPTPSRWDRSRGRPDA